MRTKPHRSSVFRVLIAAGLVALAGCAASPKKTEPEPAPAVVSLNEWMERGATSAAAGDRKAARDAWRSAAMNFPASKQPWLKLAEDYFNAGDYGNAVLASQEVLQRDPKDRMANSVLAVSGLRLTAGSLAALRDHSAYAIGSREEALALTQALRDALGEPVLVPPADQSKRRRPTAAKPAAAPAAAAPRPASGNPLDKLK